MWDSPGVLLSNISKLGTPLKTKNSRSKNLAKLRHKVFDL